MEMDGHDDDFYTIHRFKPTDEEAVTHFLPRLLAGQTHKLIRDADVYACEPKDLAAEYEPVPSAVSTGDRFFFTTCRRKNGRFARVAGAGTWTVQKTEDVYDDEGAKVGEARKLSFKKGGAYTGWVMEEYRCLLPEAAVAGGEKVLCKIHLALNKAPAAARQESDAYKLRQEQQPEPPMPEQEPVTVTAHVHKRQAPAAAADLPSCKKMRMAAPVPTPDEEEYDDCPVFFTHAAPVSLPAAFAEDAHVDRVPAPGEYENGPAWFAPTAPASLPAASMEDPHMQRRPAPVAARVPAPEEEYENCPTWSTEVPDAPEADDDMGRFSCTVEELLGVQQQQEQTLPVEEETNIEELYFNEGIEQFEIDQLAAPLDLGSLDLESFWADYYEEEAELQKKYNYNAAAADLQAPSLQGHSQFSFAAVN